MVESLRLKHPLPVGGAVKKSVGWWGLWTLVLTEAALFGYLLLCYYYLYFESTTSWPPEGKPSLLIPGVNTITLLSSSVFVWASERAVKRARPRQSIALMAIAILLGTIFVGVQFHEWADKAYNPTTNLYGSLYFTITGFHMAHVVIGLIILSLLLIWTVMGYFRPTHRGAMTIGGLYWHFVDAVWLFIFTSIYLVPYLPVK